MRKKAIFLNTGDKIISPNDARGVVATTVVVDRGVQITFSLTWETPDGTKVSSTLMVVVPEDQEFEIA